MPAERRRLNEMVTAIAIDGKWLRGEYILLIYPRRAALSWTT